MVITKNTFIKSHKLVCSDRLTDRDHLYELGVGDGNAGVCVEVTALCCVRKKSSLLELMRARCVWPTWLMVKT